MEHGARRIVCRGARAAEDRLFAEIDRWRPQTPEEAARPLRVVVPSRSLRLHLVARLAERFGALAGVVVQTVHGAALEILARSGTDLEPGDTLFELLVRRLTSEEPELADRLSQYDDGADAVVGAVRDLLDAGFEPSITDAVLERIDEVGGGVADTRRRRAAAVVRVAARVAAGLESVGAVRTGQAPLEAARRVTACPDRCWPTRAVIVHGFADVTGAVSELVLQMLRTWPGALILDRPPDPCARDRDDAGAAYLARLEVALGGLSTEQDPSLPAAPEVILAPSPNREAEARGVAGRVRGLLDAGLPPERLGVVARDPARHVGSLRRWFERLGVPFSGIGTTVAGGTMRRRVRRFAELLGSAAETPLASWLETLEMRPGLGDLRMGLRLLGAARVADVAAIDVHRLPNRGVELGIVDTDDEDPSRPMVSRLLAPGEIARAVASAGAVARAATAAAEKGTAREHGARTRAVMEALEWAAEDPARCAVEEVERAVIRELPDSLELQAGEWRGLLMQGLENAGEQPVGGSGAGVQLLSVMEARARTFDVLVVIGLERGSFPRSATEDALLPDALRTGIATDLLPFLPVKARAASEERYLFAQLMDSAPLVVCAWAERDGAEQLVASPFIGRFESSGVARCEPAPPLWPDDRSSCWPRVRTAMEHGVTAVQELGARGTEDLFAAALVEGWSLSGAAMPRPPFEVGGARVQVVERAEDPAGSETPGPWAGFVGAVLDTGGSRPWVTSLERIAACPWQFFVRDRLQISPMPDPGRALPDVDHRLVGSVVHRVLQRVVDEAIGERVESLARAATRDPVTVEWPPVPRLRALVMEAADRALREEGLSAYGMVELLAARCLPVLDVARGLVFGSPGRGGEVLGAELEGEVVLPEPPLEVRFRADRVDRGADGLVLVDYKSGTPLSKGKQARTRHEHVLRAVRRGRLMQALAYALAASTGERIGTGAYLYLRPDIGAVPEEARIVELRSDDLDAVEAFLEAVAAVVAARRTGAMFPRVVEADAPDVRPDHCTYCPVADACRRDDTGFRQRLVEWMDGPTDSGTASQAAARSLWWLGAGERS